MIVKKEKMNRRVVFLMAAVFASVVAFADAAGDSPSPDGAAGLERTEDPIFWGFGEFGFYSGYQLYGSLVNPDPVLQGYFEANVNLPFEVGPLDNLGYLGGGYWFNSDLTGRRSASYGRAFNENDPNVHWGKKFWFDEKRTWGLGYLTSVIWYCYPRTGGRRPVNRITMDWDHYLELDNPYVVPYVRWMREYRVTRANLVQFGVKRTWKVTKDFTLTPSVELEWRDRRYGWCFSNNGLDANGDRIGAGLATLKLELDAKYMFTKNLGVFAKVAYCQNVDSDLRDAAAVARRSPASGAYGRRNEFAWGGVGICLSF